MIPKNFILKNSHDTYDEALKALEGFKELIDFEQKLGIAAVRTYNELFIYDEHWTTGSDIVKRKNKSLDENHVVDLIESSSLEKLLLSINLHNVVAGFIYAVNQNHLPFPLLFHIRKYSCAIIKNLEEYLRIRNSDDNHDFMKESIIQLFGSLNLAVRLGSDKSQVEKLQDSLNEIFKIR